jgi:hypothetical protein
MGKGRIPAGTKKTRIRYAHRLLSSGMMSSEAVELIEQQFDVSPGSARRYLAEARELMAADHNLTTDDIKAESYSTYQQVVKMGFATMNLPVVVNARGKIDRLFGLVKPVNNFVNGSLNQAYQMVQVSTANGATESKMALPSGEVVSIEEYRQRKLHELNIQWSQMVIDKSKAYGYELPDDLQQLSDRIDAVKQLAAPETQVEELPTKKRKRI